MAGGAYTESQALAAHLSQQVLHGPGVRRMDFKPFTVIHRHGQEFYD